MIVLPLAVAERGREVARVDHERVAGAQDLLGHLVDDGDEGVLEHLEGDRVERVAPLLGGRRHRSPSRCIRMFSHSSTSARHPGGTTVVESS